MLTLREYWIFGLLTLVFGFIAAMIQFNKWVYSKPLHPFRIIIISLVIGVGASALIHLLVWGVIFIEERYLLVKVFYVFKIFDGLPALLPRQKLVERLEFEGVHFFTPLGEYTQVMIKDSGDVDVEWQACLVATAPTYMAIYPKSWSMREVITFSKNNIRWVSDLNAVSSGDKEITLDLEVADHWLTLRVRFAPQRMEQFERALLALSPDDLTLTRQRRRPNRRYGPVEARAIGHALAGSLVQLYLTPGWLVILSDGYLIK